MVKRDYKVGGIIEGRTTPWRVKTSKRFAFDLLQSVIDQPTPAAGKPRRRRVIKGKRSAWAELRRMAGL